MEREVPQLMASAEPDSGKTGDDDGAYDEAIGASIRAAREQAGMSRATLERDAGLKPATLASIENGEPVFVSDLRAVARALHIHVVDLLPEEPAAGGESPAAETTQ